MVDRRKRLHRDLTESLQANYSEVLSAGIPTASDVERMGLERTVVEEFAPRGRAAQAYRDLWAEIRQRLDREESQ
jgi:cellulose biosynthesis protein BcsQ